MDLSKYFVEIESVISLISNGTFSLTMEWIIVVKSKTVTIKVTFLSDIGFVRIIVENNL